MRHLSSLALQYLHLAQFQPPRLPLQWHSTLVIEVFVGSVLGKLRIRGMSSCPTGGLNSEPSHIVSSMSPAPCYVTLSFSLVFLQKFSRIIPTWPQKKPSLWKSASAPLLSLTTPA